MVKKYKLLNKVGFDSRSKFETTPRTIKFYNVPYNDNFIVEIN